MNLALFFWRPFLFWDRSFISIPCPGRFGLNQSYLGLSDLKHYHGTIPACLLINVLVLARVCRPFRRIVESHVHSFPRTSRRYWHCIQ